MQKSLFVLGLLGLAGCGPNLSVMRTGGLYPAKDKTCRVAFENLSFQQASARYEQIGLITLSGRFELDDKNREAVRAKACSMGADAVSLNASADFGSRLVGGMTQFLVLKSRQAAAAPVANSNGI